jgi:hypothetical protein
VTGAGLGLVGRGCLCCESALGATAWLSNCGILPQMMPEYSTVYRITDHPTEGLWFAASGLVPLVVGVVLAWGKRRWRWKQPGWLFCGGLIAFGIVWCGVVMLTNLRDEIAAREAYRAGNYGVVAGVVTDFKPMSANGHGSEECFTVKGREFCYSGYVIAPGFRNSASRGGPVRAGERVKVAYWNGVILGLEIAMADLPTPDERNATVAVADQGGELALQQDPVVRKVRPAFFLTMVLWTLWWNLQWRRVMRLWVRPPNRPVTQYGFRLFFAANFVGALWGLIEQLHEQPLSRGEVGPMLGMAALMCVVVGGMSAFALWRAVRRDRTQGNAATGR